jgi:cholinesterase
MGSSSPNAYFGPSFLLQKDVVFVSFNYRVGALGFLSLDDPSLDVPGNAGLKDQRLALKWIKQNIANFGGDPDNITLFGEWRSLLCALMTVLSLFLGTSAGGASVHYHLISRQSEGLFHRAIPMSGTSLNTSWALHPRRNYAERIAKLCGYEGGSDEKSVLEFLEAADYKDVVNASETLLTDEVRRM